MKLLITFSLLGILLLGAGQTAQAQQTEGKTGKDTGQRITLNIEGMACSMCEKSMTNFLKKLDGVKKVEKVDAGEGVASLWLTGEKTISDDQFKKAVEEAGFKLKKVNRHSDDGSFDDSR